MTPYEQGCFDAYESLGLTKTALSFARARSALSGAGNWIKAKAPGFFKTVKETAIGSPGKFIGEVRQGKALAPGSMIREGFAINPMFGSKLLGGALQYGLPAYQAYKVLSDPNSQNKGEAIGNMAGNMIASSAAARPFGMIGSMIAGGLGGKVGGGIGKFFDPKQPQALPQPVQATQQFAGTYPEGYPSLYAAAPQLQMNGNPQAYYQMAGYR